MIDEKRKRIREILRHSTSLGLSGVERIANSLKDEPKARLRRLRSRAVIGLDDVAVLSKGLGDEFPDLVYFFANYKMGTPTPSKFSDEVPIIIYRSLIEAIEASLSLEKERPEFNGPYYNRPNILCRLPWPEELASGDPERLIGGREAPSEVIDLAIEYRELGRWFMLRYETKGYLFPRAPLRADDEIKLDAVPIAGESYLPFQLLDFAESEFFTLYDSNDEETTSFAKRAYALWRRIYTSNIAHYDPADGKIVMIDNWDGAYDWNVGKRALANALDNPPRYAGFAPRPDAAGRTLMLGPKPSQKKA